MGGHLARRRQAVSSCTVTKGKGRGQMFRTCWGEGGSHQGLVGREKGGPTVVPSDGQQGHSAKLLTSQVGGGAAT